MEMNEILERLTQLHNTVAISIYGGDMFCFSYNKDKKFHWKVAFETKHDGTEIKSTGQGLTFEDAIKNAWSKFDTALTLGAAPHALMPPVEQTMIEAPSMPRSEMDDEIPF